MKTQGICFFMDGMSLAPLVAVAIDSLRQHYQGDICMFLGPNHLPWFAAALEAEDIQVKHFAHLSSGLDHLRRCWNTKPLVHEMSPFDVTLVYDCDHVFLNPFDMSLFDHIEEHGLLTCHYIRRRSRDKLIRDSICQIMYVPYPHHQSVNGGCVGSRKKSPLLQKWQTMLRRFQTCDIGRLKRLADEHSLAFVLNSEGILPQSVKWSLTIGDTTEIPEGTIGVHMSRARWKKREEYWQAYQAAEERNTLQLQDMRFSYLRHAPQGILR